MNLSSGRVKAETCGSEVMALWSQSGMSIDYEVYDI